MGADLSVEVEIYIEGQESPQREICWELRKIILKTFDGIREEMKWGVPVYGGDLYYIGSLKDKVNLGFKIEGLKENEIGFFEGSGKTMRHIKIRSLEDIDEKKIVELLKLVKDKQEQ